jgi:FolB domain-containing protein
MSNERIIGIQGLEVTAQVGVPDQERAISQRLLLDLRFAAVDQPADLGDDLSLTIDYYAVSLRVIGIAQEHPRKLIETLADEVASVLLGEYSLRWIEITIRKFILPNAEWVSVSIRRQAN